MAIRTNLRFLVKKIAQAMQSAVKMNGLDRARTRFFGTLEEESDHISLTLKTTEECNDFKLYSDFFEEVRRLIPDDTSITMYIGLVIRTNVNAGELESHAIWESDQDLTDALQRTYE